MKKYLVSLLAVGLVLDLGFSAIANAQSVTDSFTGSQQYTTPGQNYDFIFDLSKIGGSSTTSPDLSVSLDQGGPVGNYLSGSISLNWAKNTDAPRATMTLTTTDGMYTVFSNFTVPHSSVAVDNWVLSLDALKSLQKDGKGTINITFIGRGNQSANFTLKDVAVNVDAQPVPIPASMWILGSGLLGLIGIRRRVRS